MKKQLLMLLTILPLFGCSNGRDKTTIPIGHPDDLIYFSGTYHVGTLHFSDELDYVTDEFGFCHVLKHDDSKHPDAIIFFKKNGNDRDYLTKSDFKNGEKVVFCYNGETTFTQSTTDQIGKYDETLVNETKTEKVKYKKDENNEYKLVTEDDSELSKNHSIRDHSFFTMDFVETQPVENKEYLAYYVTRDPGSIHFENIILLATEVA